MVSIINRRHNEFHQAKAGFFGFYESANDDTISSALLARVAFELKREGMDIMRGPMNFSTNEEGGFLVDGFNSQPLLMTPYNPPYYIDLMEKYGLRKAKDLYAYILDLPDEHPQKIHRVAELAAKTGITVRSLNRKHFERDMLIFKDVYNSAWAKNWGFIPLTGEEIVYLSHNPKPVIEPGLTLIAEQNGASTSSRPNSSGIKRARLRTPRSRKRADWNWRTAAPCSWMRSGKSARECRSISSGCWDRIFYRVGGTQPIEADFRVIAATNKDLERAIKEGAFREDLYSRLNVISFTMPPLREHKEDIPLLAEYFLGRFAQETNKPVNQIGREALDEMMLYDWPGNVRELGNAVERAVVVGRGQRILPQDLPIFRPEFVSPPPGRTLREVERAHLERAARSRQPAG